MMKFKLFGFGGRKEAAPASVTGATAPQAASPTAAPQTPAQGKRVLIVDDDPVFLKATAAKLQTAGCQVRTATESAEAIAALGESPADAVLLDVIFEPDVCNGGMASWDGFQLLTWLRGNPSAKGARFIMVSNTDSPSNRQRAQKMGAVAYFQKPLDHDRLMAVVKAAN
jgi:DNA-binding response OmpR family regulator